MSDKDKVDLGDSAHTRKPMYEQKLCEECSGSEEDSDDDADSSKTGYVYEGIFACRRLLAIFETLLIHNNHLLFACPLTMNR